MQCPSDYSGTVDSGHRVQLYRMLGCKGLQPRVVQEKRRSEAPLSGALLQSHGMEAQPIEQGCNTGAGILARFVENAVGESSFSDLLLRGQANLRFQILVGLNQQTRGSRIDAGASVVYAGE